jgi:hypothetical protein
MAPVIQFCGGSPCFPISSVKPHEVPYLVVWGWDAMLISIFLVTKLGAMHFNSEVIVDFG